MTTEYELLKIARYGFIPELLLTLCGHISVRKYSFHAAIIRVIVVLRNVSPQLDTNKLKVYTVPVYT